MMSRDESKLPKPPSARGPLVDTTGARRGRPGGLFASGNEDEEVDDEKTWVANSSPYLQRENTAEVSYFDEHDTNIDWNGPSQAQGASEDTLNFELPSSQVASEGMPTDYGTEPGAGTDGGSLSALRDAMRPGRAKSPAPLPLPAPRAKTTPSGRPPPPPVRRVGQPQAVVHPVKPRPVPARPVRPRGGGLASVLLPVLAGAVAVLVVTLFALRVVSGAPPDADIEAPVLPVVGGPPPKSLPAPPFDVAAPEAWRPEQTAAAGTDAELEVRILQARGAGQPELAAAWSDRLVRTSGRPELFFHHAALLADVGQVDAALYWLVRAAREHGYPAEWLVQRRAFRRLWIDPRWDPFVRWVLQVGRYHAERGPSPATIVLPTSLEGAAAKAAARGTEAAAAALPVVVYLDGVGGNGSAVLPWGQELADELGVVVVGVGGPERVGPAGSWWTGDVERDRAQIDQALAAVLGVHTDPARRYLVGVGQGAQYAVELVLRSPGFGAGAMVVAPTDDWVGPRDGKAEVSSGPRHEQVLLTAGSLPTETHTLLRLDSGRLLRAGVAAELEIDDEPWGWPDGAPADFGARLGAWLRERLADHAVAALDRAAAPPTPVPAPTSKRPTRAATPEPEPEPLPTPLGPGTAPPPAAKAPPAP